MDQIKFRSQNLGFKRKFGIGDDLWRYCMSTAAEIVTLENEYSSMPLNASIHDSNVPAPFMEILKKELQKRNLNPQRFSIKLNNVNKNGLYLRPPKIKGKVSRFDYSFILDHIFFPGMIVLPPFYTAVPKNYQKIFCKIIACILSEQRIDFIIGDMLIAYKPFLSKIFTLNNIPDSFVKAPIHIALTKQKHADMMLQYARYYGICGSSSNDYHLLVKIGCYWNMLGLLNKDKN